MEYELTAEEAGKYEVIMCMANGYAEIQNCFTVAVNGQQQPGISFNAQQSPMWKWCFLSGIILEMNVNHFTSILTRA